MQKRHFELIAGVFRSTKPGDSMAEFDAMDQWDKDVIGMARALIGANPSFNRDRFLLACDAEHLTNPAHPSWSK